MAITKKAKYPRICKQGKTYKDAIGYKGSNGEYLDLSDYTGRIEVRSQAPSATSVAGDEDVLITLTTENGMITIDGGIVRMEIDADTTATFPIGPYLWELELVRSDGYIPYIMEPSAFKVTQEITLNG